MIGTRLGPEPLLIDDPDEELARGQRVAVAIRPEKMRLHEEPPAGAVPNALPGEVWDIGYLGDWTVYRVKLPSGELLRVSRANASRFVERPVEWEDRVHVSFAPEAGVILTA